MLLGMYDDTQNRPLCSLCSLRKVSCLAVILVSLLVILAPLFAILIPRMMIEEKLKDIDVETDKVPVIVVDGTVYINRDEVDIWKICKKQNNNFVLKEIFCIAEGKVYFIYSGNPSAYTWTIASVDLITKEIRDLSQFSNTKIKYDSNSFNGEYKDRSGYYCDGKIILSDRVMVHEYDILSGEAKQYAYGQFAFPQRTVYGNSIDNQTLELYMNNTVHTFKLSDMAERSKGIQVLQKLKNKKIWNGDSSFQGFSLDKLNSVQVIGDKIYTFCCIYNHSGELYYAILEYNHDKVLWMYVTWCFVCDNTGNCYVIPEILQE